MPRLLSLRAAACHARALSGRPGGGTTAASHPAPPSTGWRAATTTSVMSTASRSDIESRRQRYFVRARPALAQGAGHDD